MSGGLKKLLLRMHSKECVCYGLPGCLFVSPRCPGVLSCQHGQLVSISASPGLPGCMSVTTGSSGRLVISLGWPGCMPVSPGRPMNISGQPVNIPGRPMNIPGQLMNMPGCSGCMVVSPVTEERRGSG